MTTNWDKEVNLLANNRTEFLKLEAGQHKVTFLDEGMLQEKEFDGKKIFQQTFKVDHNGSVKLWSVTKGTTYNSLFGQIALIARNKGQITGQTITVLVKGVGKEKDYTVIEAIDLMQKRVEEIKLSQKPKEEKIG